MLTSSRWGVASHTSILRVTAVWCVIVKGAVDQTSLHASARHIVHEDRASSLAIEGIGVGCRNCSKQVQSDQNVTGSEKVTHFYNCWKLVLPGFSKQFTQHLLSKTKFLPGREICVHCHACLHQVNIEKWCKGTQKYLRCNIYITSKSQQLTHNHRVSIVLTTSWVSQLSANHSGIKSWP